MPLRPERREVLFREPEQTHGWAQPPAVLGVSRVLVMFLQMHEGPGRLDQSLEILGVFRTDGFPEPNLLQDIVRFIVALLVPAPKKRPVIGVRGDAVPRRPGLVPRQRFDKT